MKLLVSLFFFSCSLITAAGHTFVLQTEGGGLCINAGSEPRKREMRIMSHTEEEEKCGSIWPANIEAMLQHVGRQLHRERSLLLTNVEYHSGFMINR